MPLTSLEVAKGKMGIAVNRTELWGDSQSVQTTACKYPEIAAALINYLNQPEQAITTNCILLWKIEAEDNRTIWLSQSLRCTDLASVRRF